MITKKNYYVKGKSSELFGAWSSVLSYFIQFYYICIFLIFH